MTLYRVPPQAPGTAVIHRHCLSQAARAAAPSAAEPPARLSTAAAAAAQSDNAAAFIAWDLDNIAVQHAAHLALVARRLKTAVEQHLLGPPMQLAPAELAQHAFISLAAYANARTLSRFAGADAAGSGADAAARALALAGGRLVPVKTRRNAADSAMRADMLAWAQRGQQRQRDKPRQPPSPPAVAAVGSAPACPPTTTSTTTLVCVSGDHGFAGVLRYAASPSCGARVAVVTNPLRTRQRPAWAAPPDWGRFPLPAAAGCCLLWDAAWLPNSQDQVEEEAALLARWVEQGVVAPAPLPCPGAVVAVWRRPA